jgi:hypothetical protein
MDKLIERCAGLDVHKKTVAACVRVPGSDGERRQETRTFSTMTDGLLALRDWLCAHGVRVVGMESTGVYWKPVYYLLEDELECWPLNAHHLHNVPGRKTPSMSSWGGSGWLLGEPLGGSMLDWVVGHLVDPAAPDHPDPGASKDAGGVGVVVAAGDGVGVELGGPGAGQSGVVREGRHGVAQAFVARPAERPGGVLAGLAGDRHDAGQGGDGLGTVAGVATVAPAGEQLGGVDLPGAWQRREDLAVGVLAKTGDDRSVQVVDGLVQGP